MCVFLVPLLMAIKMREGEREGQHTFPSSLTLMELLYFPYIHSLKCFLLILPHLVLSFLFQFPHFMFPPLSGRWVLPLLPIWSFNQIKSHRIKERKLKSVLTGEHNNNNNSRMARRQRVVLVMVGNRTRGVVLYDNSTFPFPRFFI